MARERVKLVAPLMAGRVMKEGLCGLRGMRARLEDFGDEEAATVLFGGWSVVEVVAAFGRVRFAGGVS